MMDDWIATGTGAWLGNRWFGPWFKRHSAAAWIIFVSGTVVTITVLVVLR